MRDEIVRSGSANRVPLKKLINLDECKKDFKSIEGIGIKGRDLDFQGIFFRAGFVGKNLLK